MQAWLCWWQCGLPPCCWACQALATAFCGPALLLVVVLGCCVVVNRHGLHRGFCSPRVLALSLFFLLSRLCQFSGGTVGSWEHPRLVG